MNINAFLQDVWSNLKKEMPDVNTDEVMNKVTELGKNQNTTNGVMSWLEDYAQSKGWGAAFQNNQMWESFRGKHPNEILSHAWKTVQQVGVSKLLGSFFPGGK